MIKTRRVNVPFLVESADTPEPTPERRATMLLDAIEHVRASEGDGLSNLSAILGPVRLPATEIGFGYQQVVVTWDEDDE